MPIISGLGIPLPCAGSVPKGFKEIRGPKEPLPMIDSEHANLTPQKGRVCRARTNEIPNIVVKGGEFHPNGISVAK